MKVKMSTCAPSTYQSTHIGNYYTFLYEDVLQRYLEYFGYKVTRLITLNKLMKQKKLALKKQNRRYSCYAGLTTCYR